MLENPAPLKFIQVMNYGGVSRPQRRRVMFFDHVEQNGYLQILIR